MEDDEASAALGAIRKGLRAHALTTARSGMRDVHRAALAKVRWNDDGVALDFREPPEKARGIEFTVYLTADDLLGLLRGALITAGAKLPPN